MIKINNKNWKDYVIDCKEQFDLLLTDPPYDINYCSNIPAEKR